LGGPKAHDSSGWGDGGKGGSSWRVVAEQEPFFITLGGLQADDCSGRDHTGRAWDGGNSRR
jgi:hypothetical protein